jgi:16S rRNA (guanine527-N7)-methyltransferase
MIDLKRHSPPPDRAAPDAAQMAAIVNACGIRLSPRQQEQLWAYHSLLRGRNPDLNLTRVRNFANMVLKLYVDAMLPADLLDLPSPLLDLGTGPGMPGIPLKIYRPQLDVILAESRAKRVAFLREAVARLGLASVRIHGGAVTEDFDAPVEGVVTRAVEPIAATLARVRGCLASGGRAIFLKGPRCTEEIAQAAARFEKTFVLEHDRAYRIPTTPFDRRLVVFRRLDEPLGRRRQAALAAHPAPTLESRRNPRFKELKKLLASRGVRRSGRALAAGSRLVAEILARHPGRCQAWVSRSDREPPPAGSPAHLEWIRLAPPLFDELDTAGTRAPLLLIGIPEIAPWRPEEGFPEGASLLVPFQDPENVGAAVRSAAALGAAQVILLAESAHPFHPKALRASGGAALAVRLRQGPGIDALPEGLPIFALCAQGADIRRAEFPRAFGLLAGLEGAGLPAAWRRRALAIPIRPEVESLNAAAAVSVALWEWRRRMGVVRSQVGESVGW